ncbi:unnamed protein product [Adineta steineri]|uniref:Uncharacterized protein n=1 Tax=Adineta steineri TaxID=433720 RepID=A0A814HJA0_9BILA|nr:unnamed protein product [Adineta steineri]CAF1371141.1 unnamed protein product [Adineta steineri]CAF1372157.1 unnamed protein product [Adineta steineri]
MFTFPVNAQNERDSFGRKDPDSTFHGAFPHWGGVLFILSGFFLVVAIFGLVGYLLGFRTPPNHRHHSSTDSTAPFFVIQNFTKVI